MTVVIDLAFLLQVAAVILVGGFAVSCLIALVIAAAEAGPVAVGYWLATAALLIAAGYLALGEPKQQPDAARAASARPQLKLSEMSEEELERLAAGQGVAPIKPAHITVLRTRVVTPTAGQR